MSKSTAGTKMFLAVGAGSLCVVGAATAAAITLFNQESDDSRDPIKLMDSDSPQPLPQPAADSGSPYGPAPKNISIAHRPSGTNVRITGSKAPQGPSEKAASPAKSDSKTSGKDRAKGGYGSYGFLGWLFPGLY